MLKTIIISCAALIFGQHIFSQDWLPLGSGVNNSKINVIFDNSFDSLLYVGGFFSMVDTLHSRGIARWDGKRWVKTQGTSGGDVRDILYWQNHIFICGTFDFASGIKTGGIAFLDNNQWNSLNGGLAVNHGGINALAIDHNYLYAFGIFDSIGGIAAKSMARWDGQQWEAFAPPIMNGNYIIYDAVFYKGELYVAGNINHPNKAEIKEIARWDGQEWKDVGGGFKTDGIVADLEIYNGELYVGGWISNPADQNERCIARWDGEQWKRVGGGLSPSAVQIQNMHVWDDKLWVSSGPGTAGGLTQNAFLHYWDGTNWCQTKTVDQYAFALGSYRDTLIIGTSKYFDSTHNVQINHIAKLNMADYTDSCSHIATGVEEISDESDFMQLYPNPAIDRLFIQLNGDGDNDFKIYNSSGQVVSVYQRNASNGVIELNLSDLSSGLYVIESTKSAKSAKFIVRK